MQFKMTVNEKFNPDKINLKPIIKKESEKWAFKTVNNIKLSASGIKLNVRTGRLRSDIKHKISQSGNKTKIEIGSWKVPYAKVHDDKKSTSISSKTKKWLTVPINKSIKGRARQYPNTFVILTKKGTLLVANTTGKGRNKRLNPLFILKKFVVIKGTGYITDNVNLMKPFLISAIELELNKLKG